MTCRWRVHEDMAAQRILNYRVDWLETRSKPQQPASRLPADERVTLVEAKDFPTWYFFALYDAVGAGYCWEDMHLERPEIVQEFLCDGRVRMYTMIRWGWPQGFFLLDSRQNAICDISYFGLVPEAIGRSLGGWMLDQALEIAWKVKDMKKVTVNTCTLDHPHARNLYHGRGFRVVRSEQRQRAPAKFHFTAGQRDMTC